jgi:hypothetical protein
MRQSLLFVTPFCLTMRCFPCCHPLPSVCVPAVCSTLLQTGEYSVNLLLWHKHLLYQEEHTSLKDKLSSLTTSMKGLLKRH